MAVNSRCKDKPLSPETLLSDIKRPINYVFIVSRNNVVETIKVFTNASQAVTYTDDFIMSVDKSINWANLPQYSRNEFYCKDGLNIGLYICP